MLLDRDLLAVYTQAKQPLPGQALNQALQRTLDRVRDFTRSTDLEWHLRQLSDELPPSLLPSLLPSLSANLSPSLLLGNLQSPPQTWEQNEIADPAAFEAWWQDNGTEWAAQLRQVMLEYRNLGHYWNLTPEQLAQLEQYYQANQLLVDCLRSDCYVSASIRQDIEEGLLLPLA
jgi:hypothetical protein